MLHTGTGFLRRMRKFSDRIIKKRMNLAQRISSISSACHKSRVQDRVGKPEHAVR